MRGHELLLSNSGILPLAQKRLRRDLGERGQITCQANFLRFLYMYIRAYCIYILHIRDVNIAYTRMLHLRVYCMYARIAYTCCIYATFIAYTRALHLHTCVRVCVCVCVCVCLFLRA